VEQGQQGQQGQGQQGQQQGEEGVAIGMGAGAWAAYINAAANDEILDANNGYLAWDGEQVPVV
jgi:hypothetical protein